MGTRLGSMIRPAMYESNSPTLDMQLYLVCKAGLSVGLMCGKSFQMSPPPVATNRNQYMRLSRSESQAFPVQVGVVAVTGIGLRPSESPSSAPCTVFEHAQARICSPEPSRLD